MLTENFVYVFVGLKQFRSAQTIAGLLDVTRIGCDRVPGRNGGGSGKTKTGLARVSP